MTVVTWQQAEDTLTAAFEYLGAMRDAERAFLAAGSRTAWPEILRETRAGDYADVEAMPSPRLTRQCANLVEVMLTGDRPLANVIAEGHRALVGRVIVMQRWPGPDGFGWDLVWSRMGGELYNLARRQILPATSEAMRKAYSRAIGKVAVAMEAKGVTQR
ncbi:hypothetical protein [Novosphingobium clariflavum]|uniref:Uncharacterized protein n=1 Tax=Novosphingobium clariflavum TaxID=2029884 RepID=A0ABV6S727_9SPHN|nr:hypothetical protein [Novosphingobium clariflavum]